MNDDDDIIFDNERATTTTPTPTPPMATMEDMMEKGNVCPYTEQEALFVRDLPISMPPRSL